MNANAIAPSEMASRAKHALIAVFLLLLPLAACSPASEAQKKDDAPKGQPEVKDAEEAKKLVPDIQWVEAFPNLSFDRPVALVTAPGDDDHLYVVEKFGKIKRFERKKDTKEAKLFMDVGPLMLERGFLHNEEGLLSVVFHPEFEKNRYFYISYTAGESKIIGRRRKTERRSVVARYSVEKKDRSKVDMKSAKIILELDQPWGNHNGTTMVFGPDGYLYMSFGDGGAGGDPLNAGQDLNTWLGKILRINVDKAAKGKAYSVPKDNPFVKQKDAKPEIWAYGLRNVWRMSFDRKTGDLWAGDVGQNKWEEISLIEKGKNYGWRVKEGFHDYKGREAKEGEDYIDPIVDHLRKDAASITGGYVYRGKKFPTLEGVYFYADYAKQNAWGLLYKDGKLKAHRELDFPRINPSSFGEDQDGEIYVLNYTRRSKLLRLEAKPVDKKGK